MNKEKEILEKIVVEHADMPAPYGTYSTAVRAGDFLFVSGQPGIVPETGAKAGEGFESQARQAALYRYENTSNQLMTPSLRSTLPTKLSMIFVSNPRLARQDGHTSFSFVSCTKSLYSRGAFDCQSRLPRQRKNNTGRCVCQ